ncbi:bifunctional acetaldehyde-CoA/alcohol dehydrogenase [Nocardia acidivorans]|uniref:bifunctional acetaldehyde-CoA/alcohol dehydrogenase n=1 Tax=Nocardia acidivorans TaxID=404580 RepID=UPI001FE144C3|nr:bifunctional acetaldehyde-CoA/alcohol dehydrogenase [Nocardia acidivorans]
MNDRDFADRVPAVWTIEELHSGMSMSVPYAGDDARLSELLAQWGVEVDDPLIRRRARLLAWASFVAGMRVPGCQALVTGFVVVPDETVPGAVGAGRVIVTAVDARYGLVTITGELAGVGRVVVSALVRRTPAALDLDALTTMLSAGPRLTGRVAVVAGGSRGLGAAMVHGLAARGALVYLLYRDCVEDAHQVAAAAESGPGQVRVVRADVTDTEALTRVREEIAAEHGGADLLVLNACPPFQPGEEGVAAAEWQRHANRMVDAPLGILSELLTQRSGRIVLVSSTAVIDCPPGWDHYAAVKRRAEQQVRDFAVANALAAPVIARPPRLDTAYVAGSTNSAGLRVEPVAARVVGALSQPVENSTTTVLLQEFADVPGAPETPPQFMIAASFVTDPLSDPLRRWLDRLGLTIDAHFAGFGQVFQELLMPGSELSRSRCAAVLIRPADWLEAGVDGMVADFAAAVRAFTDRAGVPLLVQICPSPPEHRDLDQRVHNELSVLLDSVAGVDLLDIDGWHGGLEVSDLHDAARLRMAHIPYTAEGYIALATGLARALHSAVAPPFKVLALDCDNTLWHGVAGEDGPEGLQLTKGHRELQQWAAELSEQGVVVALVSKNDPETVAEVFARRPDMPLRPELVAAREVGWGAKPQSLIDLTAGLNLGLDSVVFLDDNPVEVAQMRALCPAVLTLQVPTDSDQLSAFRRRIWALDRRNVTENDRQRTQQYRAEHERLQLRRTLSFSEFIDRLELQVRILPAGPQDLRRVAQLTQRTNQFNASTRRRLEPELRALLAEPGVGCHVVHASDRFGDHGTVGVLISLVRSGELVVDTFLLSCRVLGRGVEHRMLAELGHLAHAAGCGAIRVQFRPTTKNQPVRDFLASIATPYEVADGTDFLLTAEAATQAHFDPAAMEYSTISSGSTAPAVATDPLRFDTLRMIAEELSDLVAVRDFLEPVRADTPLSSTGIIEESEIEAVRSALSRVANVAPAVLTPATTFTELGLSSMTMVEVAVELETHFGAMHVDELYEHRTLGDLAAALADRIPPRDSVPTGGPAPVPEPESSAPAEARPSPTDRTDATVPDIEIELLVDNARTALTEFTQLSQQAVDNIVQNAALAALDRHLELAQLAVTETGRGVVEDKSIKNVYASEHIAHSLAGLRTVGVVRHDEISGVTEIAEPVGVIAAITPVTSPTASVVFKALIALKTRNPIIFAFHHMAPRSGAAAAAAVREAAVAAGAPADCIQWIQTPTRAANTALMSHPGVSLILATGGSQVVTAAYSCGKPAIGVGPGNTPAYVAPDADLDRVANDLLLSVTYDNGMSCAAEQVAIIDSSVWDDTLRRMAGLHAHVITDEDRTKLERLIFDAESGTPDAEHAQRTPRIVGRSATWLAEHAGFTVPVDTQLLLAEVTTVGKLELLTREKSCPILAVIRASDTEHAIRLAQRVLSHHGRGHTAVVHTRDQGLAVRYGAALPAARIVWNAPASQGAIGALYNDFLPSLTLGCGSWGGNSVAGNVSAVHLLNIRRIAKRTNNIQWFKVPREIYYEPGCLRHLTDMPGIERAVIVTGPTLARLGFPEKVATVLRGRPQPPAISIIDFVEPEPSITTARRGAEVMRGFEPDTIIAIGGGSVMDAAKIMWLWYEHPDAAFEHAKARFHDMRQRTFRFPQLGSRAQLICVPTTSGSGSEMSPFAVVTDRDTGRKYPIGDYALTPSVALVDSDLVLDLPATLAADSGFDALTHATEAFVSVHASDFTDGLCLKAIEMIFTNLESAVAGDPDAREKMHNAAAIAGMAFSNAFLGIVHAMSHTLGSTFHLAHGRTNAVLLPHVVRYNGTPPTKLTGWPKYENYQAPQRFQQIARILGLPAATTEAAVESYAAALEKLRSAVAIPGSFAELGVAEADFMAALPQQAINAYEDQCAPANPRAPILRDMQRLMTDAYFWTAAPVNASHPRLRPETGSAATT